ncbi:glutathione S-transferase [Xylogone sp. PMI_703]|nr:glutathione S-transferase [Xylogone sp. PMI_703]
MTELKLWYADGACSLASHILLLEVEVEFEPIRVNLTWDGLGDDFRSINSKLRVPVLSFNGDLITESSAIFTAISSLAPEKHLLGRTPLQTARVYEWTTWLSGFVHAIGYGCLWRPERFSDDVAVYEGVRAKGLKTIKWCYDFIEGKLTGIHAVGDAFTVVDPYLFVFYRWGQEEGVDMQTYPKYTALVANLVQRPAQTTLLNKKISTV